MEAETAKAEPEPKAETGRSQILKAEKLKKVRENFSDPK